MWQKNPQEPLTLDASLQAYRQRVETFGAKVPTALRRQVARQLTRQIASADDDLFCTVLC